MSRDVPMPMSALHLVGIEVLRNHATLFVLLGLLLALLGFAALGAALLVTLVTMKLFGWLMIAGGVFEAVHAFSVKNWGGFFVDLLSGIVYIVVGFLIVAHPAPTAAIFTLLIAMYLIFGGVFRIVTAASIRFQNRFWLGLHGAINLLLGILIWQQWPESSEWVIGMFVGIDMLFNGLSLMMLGLAAKNLPAEAPTA